MSVVGKIKIKLMSQKIIDYGVFKKISLISLEDNLYKEFVEEIDCRVGHAYFDEYRVNSHSHTKYILYCPYDLDEEIKLLSYNENVPGFKIN